VRENFPPNQPYL